MAVTHPTSIRNSVCDFIVDKIDQGAAAGKLVVRLTGNANAPGTAVATLTFSDPAFGAASSGTATAAAITDDTSAAGNASPVATATLEDDSSNVIIHAEVAASGSDFDMTGGLTINSGDTVECLSLTYTAMP